jgi:hypothetical protein
MIQSILAHAGGVFAGGSNANVTFDLFQPNEFYVTVPCPGAPDEVFIHLASCVNVSGWSNGGIVEQVCGGAMSSAVDVVTYKNIAEPITLNVAVRYEQNVCTGVPVGDFPSSTNPIYRKANITFGAIVDLQPGQAIPGTVTVDDDPGNDSGS